MWLNPAQKATGSLESAWHGLRRSYSLMPADRGVSAIIHQLRVIRIAADTPARDEFKVLLFGESAGLSQSYPPRDPVDHPLPDRLVELAFVRDFRGCQALIAARS